MRDAGVAGNMINEWLTSSTGWKSGRNEAVVALTRA
jgi:hypothetical protein